MTKTNQVVVQQLSNYASQLFSGSDVGQYSGNDPALLGIVAWGYGHLDWVKGADLFRQVFWGQKESGFLSRGAAVSHFPIYGFLLAGLYELAPDEAHAIALLSELYPKILRFHRYLYEHRDPTEEGLIIITHPGEELLSDTGNREEHLSRQTVVEQSIQDPLFNALLVWSNECLIEIGAYLGEDVLEPVQWNELTIYSINDKLWDEDQGLYRPYDLQAGCWVSGDPLSGILPMIGEIPDQDQAERMLKNLRSGLFYASDQQPTRSVLADWLLYHGLSRFGMTAAADKIRRESLELMSKFGFRAVYPPPGPADEVQESLPFLPAAAFCLAWLQEV